MSKLISIDEAISKIEDGMTVMIGGFLATGTPEKLVDALVAKGVKNLTIISNDTGFVDKGVGKLIVNKQVKKVIASHIGTNKETGNQMHSNELEVELVPQGTLAERIRCGGAGLGGFLTPTGIGTIVQDGKEIITVDEKNYILEKPLHANIALIFGSDVDKKGNIYYHQSTRNFNPLMATAADIVIAEAENFLDVGEMNPNHVMTPHIFIDYIVKGDN